MTWYTMSITSYLAHLSGFSTNSFSNQRPVFRNNLLSTAIITSVISSFLSVGSSPGRFIEIQSELKRLQTITPSSDPPEAERLAGR
ncbi:hypothetical protein OS493_030210 [Desmophyllum pertusum]|uniref:Uncharacterized protein n=1 Tax=Desmophyllum pertusum TaxID=174260 RepID=A0A9X0CK35_9CNID|nr:hypothetical protein OS493_030210 [Desmophyllum pertusum]